MLEFGIHQGTSLYGAMDQDGLRVLAVSETHAGAERHLLWAMCAYLQRVGYPTLVLDGWAEESHSTPGLADLLSENRWIDSSAGPADESDESLAVLPAAKGLWELMVRSRNGDAQALQALHSVFRGYAVVIVVASPETLASDLWAGTGVSPLIVMQRGDRADTVSTYSQLKLLALHAGLSATLACQAKAGNDTITARAQLDKLCAFSQEHLGIAPAGIVLDPAGASEVQRLALALMDRAVRVSDVAPCPGISWKRHGQPAAASAKSH